MNFRASIDINLDNVIEGLEVSDLLKMISEVENRIHFLQEHAQNYVDRPEVSADLCRLIRDNLGCSLATALRITREVERQRHFKARKCMTSSQIMNAAERHEHRLAKGKWLPTNQVAAIGRTIAAIEECTPADAIKILSQIRLMQNSTI